MNKFVSGKASILVLTAVFAVAAFLLGKSTTSVLAIVKTNLEWDATSRIPGECYLDEEEKIKQDYQVTYTCSEKNGANEDCTLGETMQETVTRNNCSTEKAYCHATESEGNPYTYLSNTAWVQHIQNNGTPQSGHELDFFTFEGDRECVGIPDGDDDGDDTGDDDGDDTQTTTDDVCANIDGVQTSVPDTLHLDSAGVNCVGWDPASAPEVPSAPQGQVLGATTLAKTGSFAEVAYLAIMGIGGALTTLGFQNLKKAYKKSK